jgi:hypothetical protein
MLASSQRVPRRRIAGRAISAAAPQAATIGYRVSV